MHCGQFQDNHTFYANHMKNLDQYEVIYVIILSNIFIKALGKVQALKIITIQQHK